MNSSDLYQTMRTAFLTSYPNIFTDIHYASEFFSRAVRIAVKYGFGFQPEFFEPRMCIEIEARYKALNALINQNLTDRTVVIEIAAGLSPRKTEFDSVPYYELDLPPIIEIKKEIYQDMHIPCNGLIGIDLCEKEKLSDIVSGIVGREKGSGILIVSEGLFWYLKRDNISGIIEAFRHAFNQTEWNWITSDCNAKKTYEPEYRKVIGKSSNKSPNERFVDFEDERAFFSARKLYLERYHITDLIDIRDVYSGRFFNIPENEVRARIENYTDLARLSPNLKQ